MAAGVEARVGGTAGKEVTAGVRYVARQPILDVQGKVHGYELLFRAGPEQGFRGDGDLATRTMIDNTLVFGLGRLTCGLPGFVNCTVDALTGNLVRVMPSGMTVLEILESIEPTAEVIEACHNLKAAGFRLALDDFTWRPGADPLVEMADYIKIDFTLSNAEERRILLARLSGYPVALIAEKVETQEQFERACDEGFALIQGYYFCRPMLLENHKVPANRMLQMEILRYLQDDSFDVRELAPLVKRDTSLTYRLLRLVNSPLYGLRQEVRSVKAALIVAGEVAFRRMATLAITSELNAGQPTELLRMAMVRARFCELAAEAGGLDPTEQYLLGLLSLLGAMLRVPMKELTPMLPLREEIRRALEGEATPERSLLAWLEGHERGDWTECDAIAEKHGLEWDRLPGFYEQAVEWAEEVLSYA